MYRYLCLLCCMAWSPGSFAQYESFPQYFEVSGIAEDDVLNVRSGPSTRHRIVGKLGSDAGMLEILEFSTDGRWARVLWGEGNAWVFAQYLRSVSPANVSNTLVPVGLRCSGSEPYWDFAIHSQTEVAFKELFSDTIESSSIESVAESGNRLNFPAALLVGADDVQLTAVLDTRQCDDGMTDREYGWVIDLLVTERDKPRLYSGCCSL